MEKFTNLLRLIALSAAATVSTGAFQNAKANTYTAIASGNFSSTSTWSAGLVPPSNSTGDFIIVPTGITVNLDQNESLTGTLATLNVNGAITANTNTALVLSAGSLVGTGSINVDSMALSLTSGFLYTGSITAQRMSSFGSAISSAATVTVVNRLYLLGGILAINAGSFNLSSNATIVMNGGIMSTGGGSANLTNGYNVLYTGSVNASTGLELSGNGLTNIEIATAASTNVNLSSDINIRGMLTLTSGHLRLNNHNLTFSTNGNFSANGSGTIISSNNSNLTLNTSGSFSGGLRFASDSNSINNLTVNLTSNTSTAKLGSMVQVNGMLSLQSGRLDIDTNMLMINTNGSISGGSSASYVVTRQTGRLAMNIASGASATYHVGTTANYAPAILTANSGNASGTLAIGVNDSVRAQGTTGGSLSNVHKVVNATWHVTSAVSSNININLQTMWSASMEVNGFNRSHSYIAHYTNGAWDTNTSASATTSTNGMFTLSRNNITSLSPFAVYDQNDIAPTSVGNITNSIEVAVFPNPASVQLSFDLKGQIVKTVAVYNSLGILVKSASVDGNTIDINDLSAGVYYINLTGADFHSVQKFVKQ